MKTFLSYIVAVCMIGCMAIVPSGCSSVNQQTIITAIGTGLTTMAPLAELYITQQVAKGEMTESDAAMYRQGIAAAQEAITTLQANGTSSNAGLALIQTGLKVAQPLAYAYLDQQVAAGKMDATEVAVTKAVGNAAISALDSYIKSLSSEDQAAVTSLSAKYKLKTYKAVVSPIRK